MKVEIEINEEDIKNYIQKYCQDVLTHRFCSMDLKNLIEQNVKETLLRTFDGTSFREIIETTCQELARQEIERVAQKKIPGWVNRQMKEMLKYARASFWDKEKV